MSVFSETSYKSAVKNCVHALQKGNRHVTLKQIAKRIRIQYTYLSKTLNDPETHLSQDRLFRICVTLGLGPEETDFLLLLREHESADDPEWRAHLFNRIERARRAKQLNAEMIPFGSETLQNEMNYFFDPLAKVVLISLCIPTYLKEPRLLCAQLGITPARLKQILHALADIGHIELSESGGVKRVVRTHIHYGRDHPLVRVHQGLFKTLIQSQLMRVAEEDKHSVLVTFNLDSKGFEKAKDRLQEFLKQLEEIAKGSKDEGTYQLNLDLFRWL